MSGQQQDHFNRGGLIAFMFSMVFVFAFMFYLVVLHPGVNLDEKVVDPAAAAAAGPAFDITKVSEPWVPNDQVVEYGHKIFSINCATCHGQEGKGDGPGGASLNPKPRNLVEGNWKMGAGSIAHYKVLQTGIPGSSMVSFKGSLKPADRWALVQFIQSITQNKGNDDQKAIADFAKSAD